MQISQYCSQTTSHVAELFDVADQFIFKTVLSDSYHVLQRIKYQCITLDLAFTI